MRTPVPIRKLLKKYLDDLSEESLREFQWDLVQIEIDGSKAIPRFKLENATRETTADKLVEVFGEDGAVERTVDTLREIQRNDLASKLVQAKVNQSPEQKEDEPETSSAREKPREVDPSVLKDLSCSICLSLFTDPVVLQCGHSFCQSCIHKDWEMNIVRKCPLCKQDIPEGSDPPINFSLKNLCENYRGRSQGEPSGGHRNNTESFQTENIREKQEAFKKVKQWRDSQVQLTETQSCNAEKQIRNYFKRRRALLDEEEMTALAALRKQTEQKICAINEIADMFTADLINDSQRFWTKNIFLENLPAYMVFILRARMDLKKLRIRSKAQMNVSKHWRNLPLTVLEKIGKKIKQTPVVLDPKTESSSLSDDDHQTEVKFNDKRKLCPGNTERSSSYQQNLQKSRKRRRAEPDNKDGKESFHDPDNNTPIQSHEGTFTQRPVFYFGDETMKAHLTTLSESESESEGKEVGLDMEAVGRGTLSPEIFSDSSLPELEEDDVR